MASATRKAGRWQIASRVFAATIPAYILANTASVLLGFLWPGEKINGVAYATLLSFAIYTAIIMWVFSVARLRNVWIGLVGGIVATAAAAWLLHYLEVSA